MLIRYHLPPDPSTNWSWLWRCWMAFITLMDDFDLVEFLRLLISLFSSCSDLRGLAGNLNRSKCKKTEEDLIALPGNGEILFSDPASIMRGERQRHLVKTNINIWIMIEVLNYTGDVVDEGNTI